MSRTEKKLDDLIEAVRAFQGEVKKGLQETNTEIGELRNSVNVLINAHKVDEKTGKMYHKAVETPVA